MGLCRLFFLLLLYKLVPTNTMHFLSEPQCAGPAPAKRWYPARRAFSYRKAMDFNTLQQHGLSYKRTKKHNASAFPCTVPFRPVSCHPSFILAFLHVFTSSLPFLPWTRRSKFSVISRPISRFYRPGPLRNIFSLLSVFLPALKRFSFS